MCAHVHTPSRYYIKFARAYRPIPTAYTSIPTASGKNAAYHQPAPWSTTGPQRKRSVGVHVTSRQVSIAVWCVPAELIIHATATGSHPALNPHLCPPFPVSQPAFPALPHIFNLALRSLTFSICTANVYMAKPQSPRMLAARTSYRPYKLVHACVMMTGWAYLIRSVLVSTSDTVLYYFCFVVLLFYYCFLITAFGAVSAMPDKDGLKWLTNTMQCKLYNSFYFEHVLFVSDMDGWHAWHIDI